MSIPRCAWMSVAALLVLAGAAAAGPPRREQVEDLLRREPINLTTWPKWSPRLREWSGEHIAAADPAFQRAFDFLKKVQAIKGDRPTLPRELERDPVAWALVAGMYLGDGKSPFGRVGAAKFAEKAARRSVQLDASIARAHYLLYWAITQQQLAPSKEGGPKRPDRGRLEEALRHLKEARGLDPRGKHWMEDGLAGRVALEAAKLDDAEMFLREMLERDPGDVRSAQLLARVIPEQGRPRHEPYAASMKALVERFPKDDVIAAHYARALFRDGKRDEAKAYLQRARQLGTDPARVLGRDRARDIDQGQRPQPGDPLVSTVGGVVSFFKTVGWWAMWFAIVYGAIMALMCVGGLVLGRYTRGPRAADLLGKPEAELAGGGQVVRTLHESRLTKFYAVALLLALLLFYLSLPFVFVGLLIVFLVAVALAMLLRRDPEATDAHAALLRASGGGMKAVFKAMFARVGTGSFGVRKRREQAPKLYAALAEVARRVDTDAVDEVWIAPGAEFGVHQEGRGPFGVFGGRKRVLTLGLCVLHYLTVSELKSILAHEYAHFSHADTFWNRFLFQVTLSLRTAMREMARTGGALTYVNPFYWFFWLYSKSYSLLAAGFSRSREFLADRMACTLYGAEVFARALRKVCTDGTHFESMIYTDIVRLLKAKKAYVNMYLAFRKHRDEKLTDEERRRLHQQFLDDKPSLFASHPTFRERLEAARQLPRATTTEDASALQLFDDPEQVERELTDFLTGCVARHMGI
jgi:Zn-dependent protease with chaperone function